MSYLVSYGRPQFLASGDTYTQSEIKDWIEQAGMTFVERKETRSTGLMIGKKG